MSGALILAGLGCLVVAAFLVSIPAGLAVLGCVLCFVGWASFANHPPKE